jgi:hypothetical protein
LGTAGINAGEGTCAGSSQRSLIALWADSAAVQAPCDSGVLSLVLKAGDLLCIIHTGTNMRTPEPTGEFPRINTQLETNASRDPGPGIWNWIAGLWNLAQAPSHFTASARPRERVTQCRASAGILLPALDHGQSVSSIKSLCSRRAAFLRRGLGQS